MYRSVELTLSMFDGTNDQIWRGLSMCYQNFKTKWPQLGSLGYNLFLIWSCGFCVSPNTCFQ